ncbi:MAG: PhoH family protein [Desulfurococcaceae archaeon]
MHSAEVFAKLKPQSAGQEDLLKALANRKYEVIGLFGPTGCGKSLISILYGLDSVISGKYKRFIITRPLIDVVSGKELTVADIGDVYYKVVSSYLEDIVSSYMSLDKLRDLINKGLLVFADSRYIKGRTFDDSIILVDDVQSLPVESAIEVIARLGMNSRLIVAGDPIFQRPMGSKDSVSMLRELLLGEDNAKVIDLGLKDIVRPGARRGIKLLLESKLRSRTLDDTEKSVISSAKIHAPDAEVITVVSLVDLKKEHNVHSEYSSDALLIVKEGHLGRLVGKGGERITSIEKEVGLKLRSLEVTLDFKPFIRAIHPVSWIYKHIVEVDFEGPNLAVRVDRNSYGAFIGQRGTFIRYLDHFFKKILDVGVKCYEIEVAGAKEKKPKS